MKASQRNITLDVLTFLVALIAVFVISPFELIFDDAPWWWHFLFAGGVSITSMVSNALIHSPSTPKQIALDSFAFTVVSLIFLLFAANYDHLIVYLLSFVIMPLPLIAIRILLQIQVHLKQRMIQEMERTGGVDQTAKQFDLMNESGKLILSLPENRIICFEANDNYVVTYYLDHNFDLKKSMDRASLKQIENVIVQNGFKFLRVHKSYLINPLFIERIMGRSQAHKLKLHFIEEPVSVSRNFDVSQIKPQPVISKK
jgi:hypothetical protein